MSMKKKLLSGVLAAAMLGTTAVPVMAKDFPDTAGHWAQVAIGTWSGHGVVKGDDQGEFSAQRLSDTGGNRHHTGQYDRLSEAEQ